MWAIFIARRVYSESRRHDAAPRVRHYLLIAIILVLLIALPFVVIVTRANKIETSLSNVTMGRSSTLSRPSENRMLALESYMIDSLLMPARGVLILISRVSSREETQ